jgi:RES domain-containing protein
VFVGSGAARRGGRWMGKGRAVIHAAETYALAALENLVQFNASELPPHLVVCEIHISENVSRQIVRRSARPDFELDSSYEACRAVGDRWHEEARTALLIVPSRLSPFECNLLVHPQHRDVAKVRAGEPVPARLEERLKGLLGKRRQPR